MPKDYYKILGVARNATKEEIKKAYRALAHKYHPDKGGDEQRFKEINEAYQILADDRKRSQYDQFGQVFEGSGFQGGFQQGGFEWPGGFRFDFGNMGQGDFDFSDIFEDFFAGMGGGGKARTTRGRRGKDIKLEVRISFAESIFGGKQEATITKLVRCSRCQGSGGEPGAKQKTCPACQGRGNVQKTQRTFLGSFTQVTTCQECSGTGKRPDILCTGCRGRGAVQASENIEIFIPRGVKDGEVLKMTGKGEASFYGGTPGDLYIKIQVIPHEIFSRQGDDIVMQLPISLSQAILGSTVEINSLDGIIKLKVPEGTQPGDVLKLRGKGAFSASGYGRGDLLIEIKVDLPRKTSKKVKEIIEELKKEGL